MTLRGKLSIWIVAIVLAVVFVIPKAMQSPLLVGWVEQYSEAVEAAQEDDDDDDDDGEHESELVKSMQVRIDDEIGEYAGIEVESLTETEFFPEVKARAKVVNIRPMLTLQARHNQAVAAFNVAKVAEGSAMQELTRLKSLAKGAGSVAAKKVNYAEATYNEEKAKLQGLNFEIQAVRDEALQSWGEVISGWIFKSGSKSWRRLLSHQDSLLLLTLPVGVSLPSEGGFIRLARDGERKHARKAYFVSSALITDQDIQGETYFFKSATGKLRVGMRLDAWLAQGEKALKGVFVPEKAVVWNEGQPWVYIQLEDELYERRSVSTGLASAGGFFMEDDIKAGDRLVTRGTQMLLSEEFRWQILDEDDD
ncbi:MAG: hypothetical protein GQ547_01250 [Methylophaga sp.]|nr:hypothetical protein [Methylophaga sp.]